MVQMVEGKMKYEKVLTSALVIMVLMAGCFLPAWAAGPAVGCTPYRLTASGVVVASPARLLKISLVVNSSADGTIIVYNSINGANGTVLYQAIKTKAAAGSTTYEIDFPQVGVYASLGIYVSITAASCTAVMVWYDQ